MATMLATVLVAMVVLVGVPMLCGRVNWRDLSNSALAPLVILGLPAVACLLGVLLSL